jgi:hypothetical protein
MTTPYLDKYMHFDKHIHEIDELAGQAPESLWRISARGRVRKASNVTLPQALVLWTVCSPNRCIGHRSRWRSRQPGQLTLLSAKRVRLDNRLRAVLGGLDSARHCHVQSFYLSLAGAQSPDITKSTLAAEAGRLNVTMPRVTIVAHRTRA